MSLPGTRDQALWQFFLALLVLSFGLQRVLGAWIGVRAEAAPIVPVVLAAEAVLAAVLALGVWLGRRWAPHATLALGVGVAIGAVIRSASGPLPAFAALSQGAAGLVAAAGLAWLLHHEFADRAPETSPGPGSTDDRWSVDDAKETPS